jgi:hypothetical protein
MAEKRSHLIKGDQIRHFALAMTSARGAGVRLLVQ